MNVSGCPARRTAVSPQTRGVVVAIDWLNGRAWCCTRRGNAARGVSMTTKRTRAAAPQRTFLWVLAAAAVGCRAGGALSDTLAGEDAGNDGAAIALGGGVGTTNDGSAADSTAAGRGAGIGAPDATPANEVADGTPANTSGDGGTAGEEAAGGAATIGPINLASSTLTASTCRSSRRQATLPP
jgi:hypothetical protein